MYSLNGTMVWPAHLLAQHQYREEREGSDVSAYVVIVMMFYAAGIILMMARYGGGGGASRRKNEEEKMLLGEGPEESPRAFPARFFQAIMGKNGNTRHTLDLNCDHANAETV